MESGAAQITHVHHSALVLTCAAGGRSFQGLAGARVLRFSNDLQRRLWELDCAAAMFRYHSPQHGDWFLHALRRELEGVGKEFRAQEVLDTGNSSELDGDVGAVQTRAWDDESAVDVDVAKGTLTDVEERFEVSGQDGGTGCRVPLHVDAALMAYNHMRHGHAGDACGSYVGWLKEVSRRHPAAAAAVRRCAAERLRTARVQSVGH